MELVTSLLAAFALDYFLGEPRRFHPLVGFGQLAERIERLCYDLQSAKANAQIGRGVIAVALATIPLLVLAVWLEWKTSDAAHWFVSTIILYFAIGHASLREHALAVCKALETGDIHQSRQALSHLVSRDTDEMQADEISAATIESVLENGNDAVFGALFWFVVAGVPGVIFYRLVNTLDAMWGYKNNRYLYFGRAAALLDDWLNWLPARLTVISYALLGDRQTALRCWSEQGTVWKSPNAGPVMAAGAGALGILLGGSARYHGEIQYRPPLGCGSVPNSNDIHRSLKLVFRTVILWIGTVICATLLYSLANSL